MDQLLRSRRARTGHAFTLIEMLVVLAILAIFTGVLVPGLSGVVQGYHLLDGGARVVGELTQARQEAITRNQTVEVRFYKNSSDNQYDCMISLIPAATDASEQWLEKPLFLPTGVIFNTNNNNYSPLITTTAGSSPTAGTDTGAGVDASSPSVLHNESYVAFHFRPDGRTDLDAGAWANPWCVTLNSSTSPAGPNDTPAVNYITVILDPLTGRARLYQPH